MRNEFKPCCDDQLALNGRMPVGSNSANQCSLVGMLSASKREKAVLEVLRSKRLLRYYGSQVGPSIARATGNGLNRCA